MSTGGCVADAGFVQIRRDDGPDARLVHLAALNGSPAALLAAAPGADLDELRDAAAHGDLRGLDLALGRPVAAAGEGAGPLTRARHAFATGAWDQILALAEDGDEPVVGALAATVLAARGAVRGAQAVLDRQRPVGPGRVVTALAHAELLVLQQRRADALRHLEVAAGGAEAAGQRAGVTAVRAAEHDLRLGLGRSDSLDHSLDKVRAAAHRSGTVADRIHLLRAVARTECDADAAREAVRLCGPGRPWLRARAQLDAYRVDGSDPDALIAAHGTFARLGAVPWRQEAARCLRSAGLPVPRLRATSDAVAARRREVTALVASGHTNGQVATRLGVSVKTVEADLTSLYRRAGCSSRALLAAAATAGRM